MRGRENVSIASSMLRFGCSKCYVGVLSAPKRRSFSRSACHALVTTSSTIVMVSTDGNIRTRAEGLFGIYIVERVPVFAFVGGVSHSTGSAFRLLSSVRGRLNVTAYPVG